MAPDGYVPGVVRGKGTVFLGTGGAENGDNRNIDRRGQVHRAAIVADEEGALFKLGRQLSQAGFAGEVDHSTLQRAQRVFELLIESDVTWSTYEEDLCVQFVDESAGKFLVACQGPAFGGQIHAGVATPTGK